MMGFYMILAENRSLAEVGAKLGAAYPCEVFYHPQHQPYPGDPCDVSAQGDTEEESIHIELASDVEERTRVLVADQFGEKPVKIYMLTYRDPGFLKKAAATFLDDPLIWIEDEYGPFLHTGRDFLKRLDPEKDPEEGSKDNM